MHATSVYIAHEQFIRHQPVVCTLARSKDFCTHVVHVLLHTRMFVKFKLSCTVQNMSNSVHNNENYTRNALINSHINYQGNSACNKNILIMALIVVSCCRL